MSYDGTPSLPPEIQQRILNTFRQTRELAAQGSTQEAVLGCDFILRMDPGFRPARELMRALESGGTAPPGVEEAGNATVRMPAVAPAPVAAPAAAAPPAVPSGNVLEAALSDLLAKRDLRRLVQAAEENRTEVAQSPALRKMVETAYARLEAEPYIKNYLDSARAALGVGDFEECDRLLNKARSLDPTAAGIEELAAERKEYEAPGDAFGGDVPAFLTRPRTPMPPSAPLGAIVEVPEVDLAVVRADLSPDEMMGLGSSRSSGGDGRIQELLDEGQRAFDRGEHQEAIDCWSRIFLIDIDHEDAANRIENARRQRSEVDRRVEQIFHEGVSAYEIGEPEKARKALLRVLAMAPGHVAAREYLDQLGGGSAEGLPELEPIEDDLQSSSDKARPSAGQALAPPQAPARPTLVRPRVTVTPSPASKAAPKPKGSHKNFLLIGGTALALILAVGSFVWFKRDHFFPNFGTQEARQGPDPILRAKKQYDAGKLEVGIKVLRAVPASEPSYTEAQTLATAWELELKQRSAAQAQAQAQANPELAQRRERLLSKARESFEAGENLLADAYFRAVAKEALLPPDDQQMATEAALKLDPLRREIDLVRGQDWTLALPELWRRRESGGSSPDLDRLIFNCYYNLAVRDLQGGDTTGAVSKLDQALKVLPREAAVGRIRSFASTYSKRPKDLLYRIYVNHLPIL